MYIINHQTKLFGDYLTAVDASRMKEFNWKDGETDRGVKGRKMCAGV